MIVNLDPEGWVDVEIRTYVTKKLVELVLDATHSQTTPQDYLQACSAVDAYLTAVIDDVANRTTDLASASAKA